MLEALKLATIIHTASTPEYRSWPTARFTALTLAARNGYRSVNFGGDAVYTHTSIHIYIYIHTYIYIYAFTLFYSFFCKLGRRRAPRRARCGRDAVGPDRALAPPAHRPSLPRRPRLAHAGARRGVRPRLRVGRRRVDGGGRLACRHRPARAEGAPYRSAARLPRSQGHRPESVAAHGRGRGGVPRGALPGHPRRRRHGQARASALRAGADPLRPHCPPRSIVYNLFQSRPLIAVGS
ncbi:hypothetical protein T492DRAFT_39810 [Pavlovales sp. CCMP2436]|nr:hypothetical protein T492DRAFT_39810 [Pavlovales sp. CCMP2436]